MTDIDFEALAHVLANCCRRGGRMRQYHSLAAHVVIVSEEIEALDGLREVRGWSQRITPPVRVSASGSVRFIVLITRRWRHWRSVARIAVSRAAATEVW